MNPNARPQARIEARPMVQFGTLDVRDEADERPTIDGHYPPEQLVFTQGSTLALLSGGNDFHPSVAIELWAEEPEPAAPLWEYVEEADVSVTVGTLRLYSVGGDSYGPPLTVPAGRYRVRICCRGRAHAPIGESEYFANGPADDPVEWWLLRYWKPNPSAA